jgi:integrase
VPRLRLTDAAVKKLKPPTRGQADFFDELLPSFGLRVSHAGTRAWIVMTRVNGRLRRFTVGRYPAMPLEAARKLARTALERAQVGRDHRDAVKEELAQCARSRDNSFATRVEEFFEAYVRGRGLRPSTQREYRRILQGPDTAHLGMKSIDQISKDDIVGVLVKMEKRGSKGAAERSLAYLRKFFGWSADQGLIDIPPTARVRVIRPNNARDRVLSDKEIATVWLAFEAEGGAFGALFKLLLLTGQRRGEVAGMQWTEISSGNGTGAIWEVPATRTKNHRNHLVPLSMGACDVLSVIPKTGSLVFSTTGTTPVSGFGKAKARIDKWISENEPMASSWTLHDLRRTMVTVMNEYLQVPPHVVEAVVNHISGDAKRGVAGIYNRALYLEERRAALKRWNAHIDGIVGLGTNSDEPLIRYRCSK